MKTKQIIFLFTAAMSLSMSCKTVSDGSSNSASPVLPAYTIIQVPGGTVKTEIAWGASANYPLPQTIPAFKIGETEVTYELWYVVRMWATSDDRGANKYIFVGPGNDGAVPTETKKTHPVTNVSWRDCVVWCNAYSEATGKAPVYYENAAYTVVLKKSETFDEAYYCNGKAEKAYTKDDANGFRLPTEAQWEYAARGGVPDTGTPWTYIYAGGDTIDDVAWYGSMTYLVKTKAANILGLYDMSGNVWEWCWDKWSTDSVNRVMRGGSWGGGFAANCTVTFRSNDSPSSRGGGIGFRDVSLSSASLSCLRPEPCLASGRRRWENL
jgi:formylglycine-generating enzyme required for sulfatase activity